MKATNIEFDGIDYNDYPDFCDAHIVSADNENGDPLTEEEIEELNEDQEFIYDSLINYLF